ncbi:MAG: LysR family transcriptional regulator [Parvibaculales bacterium]
MKNMDWDDLRFFLAVAGAGSLSAAAKQLRVNTTTVLRRIAHLEEALDTRLFERLRSGYQLTQNGVRLRDMLDPVDQNLSALERDFQAGGQASGGLVKLSASEVMSSEVLATGLAAFHRQHSGVTLTVLSDQFIGWGGSSAAPRIMNPLRDVDMTIRAVRPTDGDMLMRKIGDMAYGLYAAKNRDAGLFDKKAVAKNNLSDCPLVGFAEEEPPVGPVWWLSRAEKTAQIIARSSSAALRARMIEDGSALSALPCVLGDKNPNLERVIDPEVMGGFELWLLVRKDLAKLSHVRQAMDFVIDHVQHMKSQLLGSL